MNILEFLEKVASSYIIAKLAANYRGEEIPASECGYVDDEGNCHYPLNTKKRIRNAIARYGAFWRYVPNDKRDELKSKIQSAAEREGINISEESAVSK